VAHIYSILKGRAWLIDLAVTPEEEQFLAKANDTFGNAGAYLCSDGLYRRAFTESLIHLRKTSRFRFSYTLVL
jgi:hypothetical protein